jgi:Thiamine pyrophosphate-requiring enzymes [acetolactate synthase, pyruvate dehydrogenase (cytochrome), glyoxylate carboligase, phosphonopyruvate decarboxylase]
MAVSPDGQECAWPPWGRGRPTSPPVADANLDRAPLVAISGQAGRDRVHKESHQHVDIVETLRPLTKWNTHVETAAVIPEVIRKAFKLAEAEKPGACHIEVPEDVAGETVEGLPCRRSARDVPLRTGSPSRRRRGSSRPPPSR